MHIAGPAPRVSGSIGLGGGTPKFAFLASSQIMLILLVWEAHFENHCRKIFLVPGGPLLGA